MIVRPAFYGAFRPSLAEADFTFIVIGDPHLAYTGGIDRWNTLIDWIVANKESENIQAVLLKGDYSNTGSLTDFQNTWSNGTPAKGLVTIDNLGIPWISAVGNHDYASDAPSGRNTDNFDAQLGYTRISGKSWFEGYYDIANSKATQAIRFAVGDHQFLVVTLELFPRKLALQWVLNMLDTYPDHYGIIVTHGYLNPNASLTADGDTYGPGTYSISGDLSGAEMWPYFSRKANLMMINCGHLLGANFLESDGENGNKVRQILANYQQRTPEESGLVKLRFSPSNGKIYVSDLNVLTGTASLITPYNFNYSSVAIDVTAPTIGSISASPETSTSATITWETSEPADTQVEYGETTDYGSETTLDTAALLSHSVELTGLVSGTYHYRVKSRDNAGNLATSDDQILVFDGILMTENFSIASTFPITGWNIISGQWNIISNALVQGQAVNAGIATSYHILYATTPASGNYYVQAKLKRDSGNNYTVGLLGRYTNSSGTITFYTAFVRNISGTNNDKIQLFRYTGTVTNGTWTQLGSDVVEEWTDGDTLKLDMNGTAIKVYRNGVQKISQIDATYSSGAAGLRMNANGTPYADDFEIGDSGGVLYSDNFNRNETWDTVNGHWSISAGKVTQLLTYDSSIHSAYILLWNSSPGNNYYIQSKIWKAGTGRSVGLVARYTNNSGTVTFYNAFIRSSAGTDTIELWKYTGTLTTGTWTQIGSNVNEEWTDGDTLKLSAVGTALKVYRNDILKIDQTDSSYSSGSTGLRTNEAGQFDDVQIGN